MTETAPEPAVGPEGPDPQDPSNAPPTEPDGAPAED